MDLFDYYYTKGDSLPLREEWGSTLDEAKESFLLSCQLIEEKGGGYIPRDELLLAALEGCPRQKVRVVIVGQDPYPTNPTGYSFSSNDGVKPSLGNIYKELSKNIPGFVAPPHGNITCWAPRGVLLLNMDLTTIPGKSGAHKGFWKGVLSCIVKTLKNEPRKIIWVLWGKEAQKMKDMIGDGALILEAAHPSPLNARGGFLGCEHFSKINRYFESKGEPTIDFTIPMVPPPVQIIPNPSLPLALPPSRHTCELVILEPSDEDQ